MSDQRLTSEWAPFASLMSLLVNTNPFIEKKKATSPNDFNPFVKKTKPETIVRVSMDDLFERFPI